MHALDDSFISRPVPSREFFNTLGYERKFWGPLVFVRFTLESRHTEAQCPLLGLKRTICSRVADVCL